MRNSWKVLAASAAAGGLAIGMSLASIPAGSLSAASSRAQATSALRHVVAPNKPAPTPKGMAPQVSNGTIAAYSYNWSGYADLSTTQQYFTKVSGSWTVPAVTCSPEDRLASVWVGLDGANDSTVEQTGTTSQCFEGTAYYYTWWEMYPTGSVLVGTSVKPGDKITASVTRSGTKYTLKLTDATTAGNNISKTATCALATCVDKSAEWITERPAYSIGVVPLAQFSPVKFTAASATGGGTTGAISAFATPWNITMIDATDSYTLDSTGALKSAGKAFTNQWINSY